MKNKILIFALSGLLCSGGAFALNSPANAQGNAQSKQSEDRLKIDPETEKELVKQFCRLHRRHGLTDGLVLTVFRWIEVYDRGFNDYKISAEILAGQGYGNAYSAFMSDYGQFARKYARELQLELTRHFFIKHLPKCVKKAR